MFKRGIATVLSAGLLGTALSFQSAFAQATGAADSVQAKVEKMGLGRDARVEVKLKDGSKVKGYISAKENDSFTVTDSKTGAAQMLEYTSVASIKKPSRGLSPMTWGIIGGAAAAAVVVGFTVVKPVLCDGGAGC